MFFPSIASDIQYVLKKIYDLDLPLDKIPLELTNSDYQGDCTLIVFPLAKILRQETEKIASEIANAVASINKHIDHYEIIKGFVNFTVKYEFWFDFVLKHHNDSNYGFVQLQKNLQPYIVEYSSPNTNKPLHLGHIRNNMIGLSLSRIIQANGYPVVQVSLINDRGIHICKTLVAYEKWGKNSTPQQQNVKGDKFVGDLYVKFEKELKSEVDELVQKGYSTEEAYKSSPLMQCAREKLVLWEANDEDVRNLWKTMNQWVMDGFKSTYKRMNIKFDKIYFESDTYHFGKEIIFEKLKEGILYKEDDESIWIDLEESNLGKKLLLRSDGTSVYVTQDIGSAVRRYDEFNPQMMIYVVGNEQNHHFQVLKNILKRFGFDWYDKIYHLSHGMIELPEGKMKSREGKVVDADDLMDQMVDSAWQIAKTSGKLNQVPQEIQHEVIEKIAQGALKYFILKTDARKNIVFYPEESIDFNGDTGPFIQYTHARILSLIKKAQQEVSITDDCPLPQVLFPEERELIRLLYLFPLKIRESFKTQNPALIAHYAYQLSSAYNSFYQNIPVLRSKTDEEKYFRLKLTIFTANIIERSCYLLGIEMPGVM